jgi:peptide/nickel transport system permease protein
MSNKSTSYIEVGNRKSWFDELRHFSRIFFGRKIVLFGTVIVIAFIFMAIFAPWLAPHDPYEVNLAQTLKPPSKEYLLGTDPAGRDLLSRIIYGSRISLMVGVVAIVLASIVGFAMGLAAGYFGGNTNRIIMRFTDALMSLPGVMLALIIAALLGSGLKNIMLAIAIAMVPGSCRLMCGQALTVREADYIVALRALGGSNLRIILRHVLPNCFPPLIVLMTMEMGGAILAEAGLSFLGIGIEPPLAAWGSMVSSGRQYLASNPIISLAPGLAVMLIVFAFNMVGDGLRDTLDPRLRGIL